MLRSIRRPARGFACMVACLVALDRPCGAEIIDRILATVSGRVITQSDVRGALALGLIDTDATGDRTAATLSRLIDRELMLVEVDRYAPPEPDTEWLDRRIDAVRARFADSRAFSRALAENGMDETRLLAFVRDDLRIEAYVDQRFAAVARPTDEDVLEQYRKRETEFVREGLTVPFDDVEADLRARLTDERRQTLVADWVAGLRRRAEVDVLYAPAR